MFLSQSTKVTGQEQVPSIFSFALRAIGLIEVGSLARVDSAELRALIFAVQQTPNVLPSPSEGRGLHSFVVRNRGRFSALGFGRPICQRRIRPPSLAATWRVSILRAEEDADVNDD
jgi:hypothetical protein